MMLLPQPTLPGKVSGIIALDPMTLQCGACGEVLANDAGYRDATFIILARWLFCLSERDRGGGPRRCRECQDEHARTCDRCSRDG